MSNLLLLPQKGNMTNDLAFNLVEELKLRLKEQGAIFLRVGKILKTIRDEKIYETLGADSFTEFLSDPDIGLKQATAYLYIRVYEFYVEKMELPEDEVAQIPSYKLFRLLPLLKDKTKKEALKALDDVKSLGIKDTEITIKENKLEAYKHPVVYACEKCHKWVIKYHQKNICQCENEFHLINEDL